MPGFTINGTGGGPNSLAEVRRTHRWVFQSSSVLQSIADQSVLLVLQKATRPNFTFEEAVMHHNQEQIYFAGKQSWEEISFTWYDVQNDPDVSKAMWDWVNVCADIPNANVSPPNVYKASESVLQMLDGTNNPTENWTIYNGWPKNMNWNTVDYTSTDIQLIECKFRYDRAIRTV